MRTGANVAVLVMLAGCSTRSYDLPTTQRTITTLAGHDVTLRLVAFETGRHLGFMDGLGWGNYDEWEIELRVLADPGVVLEPPMPVIWRSPAWNGWSSGQSGPALRANADAVMASLTVDACVDPDGRRASARVGGLSPELAALDSHGWAQIHLSRTVVVVLPETLTANTCVEAIGQVPSRAP